ncbi:MAG TPA: PAS domain-containing protein [Pyrinomonadaceae bacterium]|nr:PAS domain-containing protein [Pyrinomonadaceae bacterium]
MQQSREATFNRGHLAVMDDAPMTEDESVTAVFNIFAGRAAAELRRLRRDRALVEREQKLSRLFDGAMDAIVEFDADFRITNINAAAKKVFGREDATDGDISFNEFITQESRGKLIYLIEELARRSEDKQSIWIPDNIKADCSDEELDKLLAFSREHSPVCQSVCRPVPVSIERVHGASGS